MPSYPTAQSDNGKSSSSTPAFKPPPLSLPEGGGAIRGIGEKFDVNPVTGTGSLSVPLPASPGRSGFSPQLALTYDSGSGNGPFGFGWSLSLPAITRKTEKGLPRYQDEDESDVFLLTNAEDLVPVFRKDQNDNWVRGADGRFEIQEDVRSGYRVRRYRPRSEGLFARIERWTNQADPADVHWRSISKDNVLTVYGKDANSRIADPADPRRIFSWLICETRDDLGNAILYTYKAEDGQGVDLSRPHERNRGDLADPRRRANRYLKSIRYGNRVPLLDPNGQRSRFLSQTQINGGGWMFEAIFDYGEHDANQPTPTDPGAWSTRPDPFSAYRTGFEIRSSRLCQRFLMFHHFANEPGVGPNCLVRSLDFEYAYEQDPTDARSPIYSFLLSARQTGFRLENGIYEKRSLPPLVFEYTQPVVQDTVEEVDPRSLENLPAGLQGTAYRFNDLHGEGIPGILTEQAGAWYYKRNLSPINFRDGSASDRSVSAQFAPVEAVALKPNLSINGGAEFMDLAGDGQPDLVVQDGSLAGLYEHDDQEGWLPFQPFAARLNQNLNDPNLRFIDLDGDGRADVLITDAEVFTWHLSLAEDGFGPARPVAPARDEEQGPRLILADGSQSIYLADFSGDGLTDLARIRNGEVCYWPNLGYGRFGAKVTMDHSPWFDHPDQFDQARIRLADIDQSGTTDMVYIHDQGVRLYFNQSGNGWSNPQEVQARLPIDNLSDITVTDLLGNGTACLVWSTPLPGEAGRQMRYINLMGGKKPHLLERVANNLGAETIVQYAPSTQFYLLDRLAGKPWITRLPFPVHVVERLQTYDYASQSLFVTSYAYHHGYFDGEEREFRGFGMVEQRDTAQYASLAVVGRAAANRTFPPAANVDAASHVPPALTRTWFHTGVYLGRDRVSNFFAGLADANDRGEYYREPPWLDDDVQAAAHMLPDSFLPTGLSAGEEREACHALKGLMLRQEIYALDGAGQTSDYPYGHPYTVVEQSFTIRVEQPRGQNRHGVFFAHPREALTFYYERNPGDPRVQHALTLEVNEYGSVLRSLTAGYGRPTSPLAAAWDQAQQETTQVVYSRGGYTAPIDRVDLYPDDYRPPMPAETRTYHLTGFTPENGAPRFSFNQWARGQYQKLDATLEIEYEQTAGQNVERKRLIEHTRTVYRPDDLGVSANDPLALLPLGSSGRLARPGQSYRLAFTPGLLSQVFRRARPGQPDLNLLPTPASILAGTSAGQGGYLSSQALKAAGLFPNSDPNNRWWIPSGRVFHSPNPGHTAAQELAYASLHFSLPNRYFDPFGQTTTITYDIYDLLILETRDALGNQVTAGERLANGQYNPAEPGLDYRVLQPWRVMDPNRNRIQVCFDALGQVTATAVMGKPEENLGDRLEDLGGNPLPPDPPAAALRAFTADPRANAGALLGRATTRYVYDLDRWARVGQPPFAATLARETHFSDPGGGTPAILIGFTYSDGFGREVQKKVQAEPGFAPQRAPDVSLATGDVRPGNLIRDAQGRPVLRRTTARWAGTGRVIYNNKGKPVRQYEPFFSATPLYEPEREMTDTGVSPTLFYDPAGRLVATLHPDHSWEKIVFDPWHQAAYDGNDTVQNANGTTDPKQDPHVQGFFARLPNGEYLPTWFEQRMALPAGDPGRVAAERALVHRQTPTIIHFDVLGRAFRKVAHNRFRRANAVSDEEYVTRLALDIEGNQREARAERTDDQGNPVELVILRCDYDMLGNRIHQASPDSGERWTLNDAAGQPIRAWDSRGFTRRIYYDGLRRPTDFSVRAGQGSWQLAEQTVYGEGHGDALNHRGRVYQVYDGAGVLTNLEFDFKGNFSRTQRRLVVDDRKRPNWSQNQALEGESFVSSTRYDALNRPIQVVAPHSDRAGSALPLSINVIRPGYNQANLLEQVQVWLEQHVEPPGLLDPAASPPSGHGIDNIDYNAKGQPEEVDYSNGAVTTYEYDLLTYRLAHLVTLRPQQATAGRRRLQDLSYTYDPSGNVTHIQDQAQQRIFFDNDQVDPSSDFEYDSLYQLIAAQGREHRGQYRQPDWDDTPRMGNPITYNAQEMRNYVETYHYDALGNLLEMTHHAGRNLNQPGNVIWNRRYQYQPGSNRLRCTSLPGEAPLDFYSAANQQYGHTYTYDEHGSMLATPNLPSLEWDFEDQLQVAEMLGGEKACFLYDASGLRVRKVIRRANGTRQKERIYLGGFELYREYSGNGSQLNLERETLHLRDGQQRAAMIETRLYDRTGTDPAPRQMARYQISNQINSAVVELDEQAGVITYEEYHPYGSTAYQASARPTDTPKRYRYTAKERDESGLYYHGARYYAPWIGRWVSCDPAGTVDGLGLYNYVRDNPLKFTDKTGKAKDPVSNQAQGFAAAERFVNAYIQKGYGAIQEFVIDAQLRVDYLLTRITKDGAAALNLLEAKSIDLSKYVKTSGAGQVLDEARVSSVLRRYVNKAYRYANTTDIETILAVEAKGGTPAMQRRFLKLLEEAFEDVAVKQGGNLAKVKAVIGAAREPAAAGTAVAAASGGKAPPNAGFTTLGMMGIMLGTVLSGMQMVQGGQDMAAGKKGEGGVTIAEGAANLFLTFAPYAKGVTAATGTGAGALTFAAGIAATGSIMLAAETGRAAIRGEATPIEIADKFYGTQFSDIYAWQKRSMTARVTFAVLTMGLSEGWYQLNKMVE